MNSAEIKITHRHQSVNPSPEDISRFWSKVKKTDDCWLWTGGLTKLGYGKFKCQGKTVLAYRASWIIHFGQIKSDDSHHGTCVCHKCDNPTCVNPNHLFLGSMADNIKDRDSKGRGKWASGENHHLKRHPENAPFGEKNARAKLTNEKVLKIRSDWATGEHTHLQLAKKYLVSEPTISYLVRRKTWRHI